MVSHLKAGLRTLSIFNLVRVQEVFASFLRILFFEFGKNDRVRSLGLRRSQWHEQINDMQLFFGKIVTSIYTDCDYLNNKLYFVVTLINLELPYLKDKWRTLRANAIIEMRKQLYSCNSVLFLVGIFGTKKLYQQKR